MAVSRQATIKIPVKVNQTTIDKANKAITKMTGSGGSLQKAMDKLNGQFDKLDKTINNFSKNYKNGLDGVIESNKQAIKSNKKLTDQTVAGHKQVQKSLQKLADDDKKFTDSSSKHAQQHTRNMNSVARSYDHATSRIDRMNKAADKAINVGRSMSLTTLGLGASLVKGSNDAMNLQHQYKVIQNLAVYGGEKQAEAQKNVNEMRKQGEKYSLQYGVSQKKLSAGYEELTRRGYDTNQSLATQKQFLQASLASGDDYSNVVTGAAGALEAFGLKSKNTNQMTYNTKKVLNQLSYAADLTATDFKGMNDAMKYTGSAAHSAKQSIGETSSALGVLSNSNIDASIAGTSLRQILDRLVAPPKKGKAVTAMQQLGLTAQDFRDGKGNLLSLQDVFSKLNDHMKGMNPTNRGAIFNALFGQTAQNSATILSEHVKDLKGLNKQVQNAQNMHGGKGYIAELSAKNMDTAKVQTQKFQAALSDLNITFANELLPNITGLTKGMSNMIAKLADSPSWFKKLIAYGGVFVAGIAPVTLVFGGIAKAIKGVATSLGWVRKQFQTPMSNTMTNSMVRQSGKMQTGNFISRNTVTGKMANRASKNKAFSTDFDLKDSSVGSNFSKSSLGTMKSKPSNGMFRAPTEIGTAGKYSSLRNFGNKLRPSSIGRGIATSRLGRGTSFLSSKLGIASLLGKIPNPKNGIKAIGSGTKSIGKKVFGSRFVPQILKNGAVPKAGSKLLGGAKEIGSKIPYLDVAMAGTQLIGMNKKNAGGKIGSAGGMLAGTAGGAATGAAIGSVIPGLGTGIGGLIGGAAGGIGGSSIGKKIGQTIQKSLPKGVFNPIVKQWNRFKKWIGKSTKQVVKPFKSLFRGMKKLFKPVTDGWNSFQKALNTKKGQSNIKKLSKVFNFAMKPLKGLFSGVKIAFKV
ncbi:phage tail tape measure protein [Apilactobacillus timberlakei]|nr:phage tail tape measure protein [Apilactobacillus timberlakei]TPR12733.1 phage tail tape measure protein [Apilactobacillus timberlakei]